MNKRLFSIALLISALPAFAGDISKLNEGDFIAMEKVKKNGESIISVKLSKSGKAKIKKLNPK